MFILVLILLGLAFGSFVNALVWRIYKQSKQKKQSNKYSITKGRSMCVHCGHVLSAKDLIPIFSWLSLKGRCRYCSKPISIQYPLVELTTTVLFVVLYLFWPVQLVGLDIAIFVLWLALAVGFMALIVYDIRWMLLPNRIVYGLYIISFMILAINFIKYPSLNTLSNVVLSIAIAGGLFYILFQVSSGRWIGGGDVKLGFALGAVLGRPDLAMLTLFVASSLGCLYVLPATLLKKVDKKSRIPFGPFLIIATIISFLFGPQIIDWYLNLALL